jgi:hypothetical protein
MYTQFHIPSGISSTLSLTGWVLHKSSITTSSLFGLSAEETWNSFRTHLLEEEEESKSTDDGGGNEE